jgi:hypothetical protein
MSEVTSAIITMATKMRASMTPSVRPTPARMIPVAPRAFRPNERERQHGGQLQRQLHEILRTHLRSAFLVPSMKRRCDSATVDVGKRRAKL